MSDLRKLLDTLEKIERREILNETTVSEVVVEGAVPPNASMLDVSMATGMDINRAARELERRGFEQTKDFYLQSQGRDCWIRGELLDFDVLELLQKFGIEELVDESIEEAGGYRVGDVHPSKDLNQAIRNFREALEHITMLTVYKKSDPNILHEINVYARQVLDNNIDPPDEQMVDEDKNNSARTSCSSRTTEEGK